MSPDPFVSRAKAPPAERSEKGYGDENGTRAILQILILTLILTFIYVLYTQQNTRF